MESGVRSADVVAKTSLTAVVITAADFKHLAQDTPTVAKVV